MRKMLVLLVIPFFGFSQIGSIAEKTKNMELFDIMEKMSYKIVTLSGVHNMYLACK